MSFIDTLCRKLVHRHLSQLHDGRLELHDSHGTHSYGDVQASDHNTVRLRVLDDRFYRRVLSGGDLGFAEAYMLGECEPDDLTGLLRFFIRNATATNRLDRGVAWVRRCVSRWMHWLRRNTAENARKNIAAHYDLSNEFFRLFLDATRNYSSGVFHASSDTMADASRNKMRLACDRLELKPTDQLLEIGTGWGALAELAADEYGCSVTSTTISRQQFDFAAERIQFANLTDQVRLLQKDYRDLQGRYDKLVSIEMIEAVGHEFLDTFFQQCATLLKPSGRFCMQAIVIADEMYDDYLRSIDFIRAYIFPGGCLPSVSALTESAARSQLQLVQLQEYGDDYAETLRRWRAKFHQNREAIQQLGFDDRFMRMWEYYLCYCEAGFSEHQVGLVQLVFEPRQRAPLAESRVAVTSKAQANTSPQIPSPHFGPSAVARQPESSVMKDS